MNKQLKVIYKKIKKAPVIFIARHVGPDPDALASQFSLKEAINLTFPNKTVYTLGVAPVRFRYFGRSERAENIPEEEKKNGLLIVVDTPDIRRVDGANFSEYKEVIKIDHHPSIDTFGEFDYVDDKASSASEIIGKIILGFKFKYNKNIAEKLFRGIVFDTGRFMYSSTSAATFDIVGKLLKTTEFDVSNQYDELYMRDFKVIKFFGYVTEHMDITDSGLGYIKIPDHIFKDYKVDIGTCGNVAERLNHISELMAWVIVAEDTKVDMVKITIRSRGPVINGVAENFGGGGHQLASGVRLHEAHIDDPRIEQLIDDLDDACDLYKKEA